MRHGKTVQWLLVVLAALALSGCADRFMVTSFQDITSESKRQGLFKGRQYSSISIPGFITAYEPGTVYSYNPARGPLTATGAALGDFSYIVSKTIPAGTVEAPASSGSGQTTWPSGLSGVGLVKYQLDKIKTQTLKAVRLRVEMLKASVNNSITADKTKPFLVSENDAATKYAQAMTQLETMEQDLATLVAESGIMIFRWAYSSESSASAKVSEAASASGSSAKSGAGYGIINGLRVSTLYIGKDLLNHWNNVHDIGNFRNWLQIVTQVAQAREIAYSTELNLEKTFQAELELSYETAEKMAKNWKEELTLVLKMFSARFEQTANTGVLGNAKIKWRKVNWNAPPEALGTDDSPLAGHDQNWISFFQVSTGLSDLKEVLGGKHHVTPPTE